jgi:hypothetical protein
MTPRLGRRALGFASIGAALVATLAAGVASTQASTTSAPRWVLHGTYSPIAGRRV